MTKLRMSWPNRITLGRLLLTGPFVILMLNVNRPDYQPWPRYLALILFFVIALSDALDGFLARRMGRVTLLGTFLDPLADKILITCCCLLLASRKTAIPGVELPDVVVVLIIGKDLYITLGFVIIYLITAEMKIVPVTAGKFCTVVQISMVMAILAYPELSRWSPAWLWFVRMLWWTAAALAIVGVFVYTRYGTRYLNEFEQKMIKGS